MFNTVDNTLILILTFDLEKVKSFDYNSAKLNKGEVICERSFVKNIYVCKLYAPYSYYTFMMYK